MKYLATLEAVTKLQFPEARVRVAERMDFDAVDIYVLYHLRRGKRQRSMRYGRWTISGLVLREVYDNIRPRVIAIELEYLRKDVDECLERARLVGWKWQTH